MLELLQTRELHKRAGRDDGGGDAGTLTGMSCRMTLIDSVAPFSIVFLLPVREGGATNPEAGGWNGDRAHTPPCALPSRLESVSGLAHVSPSPQPASTVYIILHSSVKMVLLTSSQVSVALSSLIGVSPSPPDCYSRHGQSTLD